MAHRDPYSSDPELSKAANSANSANSALKSLYIILLLELAVKYLLYIGKLQVNCPLLSRGLLNHELAQWASALMIHKSKMRKMRLTQLHH